MLALIALQGTGLLHALHLAMAHAPASGHGHAAMLCGFSQEDLRCIRSEIGRAPRFGDGAGHRHGHGHGHDRATCAVCQVLAPLKAVSPGWDGGVSTRFPPARATASPLSVPLAEVALSTLGPRAPPAGA